MGFEINRNFDKMGKCSTVFRRYVTELSIFLKTVFSAELPEYRNQNIIGNHTISENGKLEIIRFEKRKIKMHLKNK